MKICPVCGSTDVDRIGLYELQCNSCGDVFDIMENDGDKDDEFLDQIG